VNRSWIIAAGRAAIALMVLSVSSPLRSQEPELQGDSLAQAADESIPVTGAADSLLGEHSSVIVKLLDQARMAHEPTVVIEQAVRLLDDELDRNPGNKDAWLKLGEALAIGHAQSAHAKSCVDAWRRAYELSPTDCHAGALAARFADPVEAELRIRELERRHPQCAEALYLRALISDARGEDNARSCCCRRASLFVHQPMHGSRRVGSSPWRASGRRPSTPSRQR